MNRTQIHILLLGLALCMLSCSDPLGDGQAKTLMPVTLRVEADAQTRALGDGSEVNRCVLELWMEQDGEYVLYKTLVDHGFSALLGWSFSVDLMVPQRYKIVVWADAEGCYRVEADKVTLQSGLPARKYDAFYAYKQEYIDADMVLQPLALTAHRAMACLKMQTDDLAQFSEGGVSGISLSYTAPCGMNLLTGELLEEQPQQTLEQGVESEHDSTLAVAFVFAPEQPESTDFRLSCSRNGEPFEREFEMIPLRRNFTTVLRGSLLSD